jgi:hypothetical protein
MSGKRMLASQEVSCEIIFGLRSLALFCTSPDPSRPEFRSFFPDKAASEATEFPEAAGTPAEMDAATVKALPDNITLPPSSTILNT